MKSAHLRLAAMLAALALVPLIASGCSKKLHLPTVTNTRPIVRLTAAPIDTIGPDGKRSTYVYHYKLNWVGYDPDGRVDHFLYTIDPPGSPGGGAKGAASECGKPANGDTAWCSTTLNEKEIFFTAGVPDTTGGQIDIKNPLADDIHTFVIKSVDNNGAESAPVYRSFFSFTQAPTIQILDPTPSGILYGLVTPFVTVTWRGDDPDGVFTQKPVKYKFRLFKETDNIFNVPGYSGTGAFDFARSNGDSLRKFFAPNFAGWDSSSADTTFATFTNLTPDSRYLFVVVGYDEAGAYSPVFTRNTNMLQLLVTFAGNNGPILTMFNEFFNYSYPSGGYNLDPSRYVNLEIPARQPVRFNWTAEAPRGSQMKQYRWAMDITNLDDQTQRTDERTDFKHWSQWGLDNISATVGPFLTDTTHIFFIEAEDVNGLKSLGIVSFRVIVPTFNYDLLIVNDTRLLPDQKVDPPILAFPDSLQKPIGPWPSRAELDTFLFARGGVRWRMTPNGTLSPPGLFAGYRYDTCYTKAGGTNGVVTLDTLGRYKHVIWITDSNSATGNNSILGAGVLATMSLPGHANTLAAYVTLGGRVWMVGSSIQATLKPWNQPANDSDPPAGVQKYSITALPGRVPELGAGRMVFDQGHWRSDIWLYGIDTAFPHKSVRAVGGYATRTDPHFGIVYSPDYALLPARLNPKTLVTDPVPPNRSAASYFSSVSVFDLAFMTSGNPGVLSNPILEDVNPDPDSTALVSMLDTLMIAPLAFNGVPLENEDISGDGRNYRSFPVMTYYHGFDNAPMILTGFDLWTFSKPDLVALVDFVMQQLWGLPKTTIVGPAAARAPAAPIPAAARAAPVPTAARIRR